MMEPSAHETTVPVQFTLNGTPITLDVAPEATLLDVLRERLQLGGTKKGCDHGQCGACTVHVDGQAMLACLRLAAMCEGQTVTTVEGLAVDGALHPLQAAFLAHDAYQCGYCSPGQLMAAAALLADPRVGTDDASVREAMSGNLCRCGAYRNILAAIQDARAHLTGEAGGEP